MDEHKIHRSDTKAPRLLVKVVNIIMIVAIIACASSVSIGIIDAKKRKPISSPIQCVAISSDLKLVALGCEDGVVRFIEPFGRQRVEVFVDHERPIRALMFSPDSRKLITASEDGFMRLWDLDLRAQIATGKAERGLKWAAYSKDGLFLVTNGVRSREMWNAKTLDRCGCPGGRGIAFSIDGQMFATRVATGNEARLRAWDLANAKEVEPQGLRLMWLGPHLPEGDWEFSAGHGWLASRVELVSTTTSGKRCFLGWHMMSENPTGIVTSALSPNGLVAATAGGDGTIGLWNIPRAVEHCRGGINRGVKEMVDDTDKLGLVTYLPATAEMQSDIAVKISALGFSRDSTVLVVALKNGTIKLWDVNSATSIGVFPSQRVISYWIEVAVLLMASLLWIYVSFRKKQSSEVAARC